MALIYLTNDETLGYLEQFGPYGPMQAAVRQWYGELRRSTVGGSRQATAELVKLVQHGSS